MFRTVELTDAEHAKIAELLGVDKYTVNTEGYGDALRQVLREREKPATRSHQGDADRRSTSRSAPRIETDKKLSNAPKPQTRRRRLKNDPDRRMSMVVANTLVNFAEMDMAKLDRRNLDWWIADLRRGETMVRRLRKRLEALQSGSPRTCPECGRPVAGRIDAVYCGSDCRVRAHRSRARRSKDDSGQ